MSARDSFSESALEAMLRRRAQSSDPVGLRESAFRAIDDAPARRRPWLLGPDARLPLPWPASRGLAPVLLTAALVLAAVVGAAAGARVLGDGLLRAPWGPQGLIVAPTPSPTPAPTPSPAPPVAVVRDLVYESADPRLPDGLLDVYVPPTPGPHPVAVMLHAQPGLYTKEMLEPLAGKLAAEGWTVFVPAWGVGGPGLAWSDRLQAAHRQVACSVTFARTHAAEYGGDPSTLVLFGDGAGANAAAVLALNRPAPSDGCPGGGSLGPIPALITTGGDWLFLDGQWSQIIPKDPAVLDEGLPWAGLAEHRDVRVWTLFSEDDGGIVPAPVGEPPIDWRTARDPRALRESLKASGPAGGPIDWAQEQAVFQAALTAQGYEASLTAYRGVLFATGWPALLAAFEEAAGR